MLNAMLLASLLAVTIPPAPQNRISDGAGLLSGSTQELERLFSDVEARQGVKLGLLTVQDLDDDPKAVAVRTLNFWQMSPDSVLLLISLNPRKIYLQPGSNLQYRFDERTSMGIIRDQIVPALKAGRSRAGIMNGFHAISATLPGPAVAPPPNRPSRPEPVAPVVAATAPSPIIEEPGFISNHPFLTFLVFAALIFGVIQLVRYVLRKNREAREAEEAAEAIFRRQQQILREEQASEPRAARRTKTKAADPAPAPTTTVINNTVPSNDGLVTGLVLGQALSRPQVVVEREVVREPTRTGASGGTGYSPPSVPAYVPPPPPPSPPRRSSSSSDGGGGSSYDWGSSSSSSSDSGGGGGSSYDSGGGFDSSSGGGGGGSDW